jgi:signal transduction histidine kinase
MSAADPHEDDRVRRSGWRPDVVAIAHDLRAPLTVIAGYAEVLASGDAGPLPEPAKRAVAAISAKATEMRTLVDGMLEVARTDAGAVATRRLRSIDLRTAARDAVDRAEPRARLWGDVLELAAAGAVPVRTNLPFLGRILDNLINNALTHGQHPGRVTVSVRRVGGVAEVRVEDDGHGLPDDIRERLFSAFVTEPDEMAATAGTGLGLFISLALAEQIGGSLRPEEPVDSGAAFVLTLPLAV